MAEKTVYLSLGSNLGEREENLRAAIAALGDAGVRVTRVSSFYETEPVDFLEQAWVLNCAVEGKTAGKGLGFFGALGRIGIRLGGKKQGREGAPRDEIGIPGY